MKSSCPRKKILKTKEEFDKTESQRRVSVRLIRQVKNKCFKDIDIRDVIDIKIF